MQLTMFAPVEETGSVSSGGKTSPESSPIRKMRSAVSSLPWWANPTRSNRQGLDGRTLVVCMDPGDQSRGGCWMPNISAWPNAAAVCSLSQVLETGSIPPRYFLSATACAGILRRAAKRGKDLPVALRQALEGVVAIAKLLGPSAPEPQEEDSEQTSTSMAE